MLAGVISVTAVLVAGVSAAVPQAICGSHSNWMNTDGGYTPCDIAAVLVGRGVKPVDSPFPELLNLGVNKYPAPNAEEADNLRCNPLFYNLASACGACQGSKFEWITWKEWSANCKSVTAFNELAQQIPTDMALPSWAFTPPSVTNGTWNKNAAIIESEQKFPDSVFPKLMITQTVESCKAVPTGTIAGAAIGGVAAIGVLALLAVAIFRRKKTPATQAAVAHFNETGSVNSTMKEARL